MRRRIFTIGEFLKQRRLFFDGQFFTTEDIIKFSANKLGGAHLDFNRTVFEKLDRASKFMKYGGPAPSRAWAPDCERYVILEPQSFEVLSAVHIEVIAAAASLVQLHFDGAPLLSLKRKASLTTRAKRLFGKDRGQFVMHDDVEMPVFPPPSDL